MAGEAEVTHEVDPLVDAEDYVSPWTCAVGQAGGKDPGGPRQIPALAGGGGDAS